MSRHGGLQEASGKEKRAEAKRIVVDAMRSAGGGWVPSRVVYEAAASAGLTEWRVRDARIALDVDVARRHNKRQHESLWLLPEDRTRRHRLPDGTAVVTEIRPEESAADLDRRHRKRVAGETRGHMLVGANGKKR